MVKIYDQDLRSLFKIGIFRSGFCVVPASERSRAEIFASEGVSSSCAAASTP